MISSYSILATLTVIAFRTMPVASSFLLKQQHTIREDDHTRTLKIGGGVDDASAALSDECQAEIVIVDTALEVLEAGDLKSNYTHHCEDADGKVMNVEFEGICSAFGPSISGSPRNQCAGKSCTIKELQASSDISITAHSAVFKGCNSITIVSGDPSSAFSLGTASSIMAGLLLSSAALFN